MNKTIISLLCAVFISVPASADYVAFTPEGLGTGHGAYETLIVNDNIQVTALTGISSGFDGQTAAVYLHNNQGLGVTRTSGAGSKEISGNGHDQDEALIFNFSNVLSNSVSIGLNKYKSKQDNPVIGAVLSNGSEYIFSESHYGWSDSASDTGNQQIALNIGSLLASEGVSGLNTIDRLYVKETSSHFYVDSLTYNTPEPGSLFLAGAGLVLIGSKRAIKKA